MTKIDRELFDKCRTAFESSCKAEFHLYSEGFFSKEAIKILESKDFSFSLEKSDECQQSCFLTILSPEESYACLCMIAKMRFEKNIKQELKKIINTLAENAEEYNGRQ